MKNLLFAEIIGFQWIGMIVFSVGFFLEIFMPKYYIDNSVFLNAFIKLCLCFGLALVAYTSFLTNGCGL